MEKESNSQEYDYSEDLMDTGVSPTLGITLKHILIGHDAMINRITWSPDGKLLASPSEDNSIRIWDSETGKCIKIIEEKIPDAKFDLNTSKWVKNRDRFPIDVVSVTWSPDSKMFAWGSIDGSIHIMETEDWQTIIVLHKQEYPILSLAWSPDGQYLASGSDDHERMVCIWSVKNWKLINERNLPERLIKSIIWSPDSQTIAIAANDYVYIMDYYSDTIESIYRFTDEVSSVLWLDQNEIVSNDGAKIRIWDLEGKSIKTLEGHTDFINCLSFFQINNLQILASKSLDNSVRLWNIEDGMPIAILRETSPIEGPFYAGISFHPYKPYFASLGRDDTVIRIWELDMDQLVSNDPGLPYITYTNAKVVLMGNSSTGKTCLARALMGKSFKPQESTHGMKVWNFHSEITKKTDGNHVNRDIFLWDLAGQPDYQLIHQLFLDETALGIILFDSTNPNNPFAGVDYWKKALEKVVKEDCPKILVAGRVDRGHSTVTLENIDEFCLENKFKFFIETSSKTGRGIIELKEAINSGINWEKLPVTSSPELWNDIRIYLLERRDSIDVLTTRMDLLEAFKQGHPQAVFTEDEFNTVISHAQAQGLLWRLSFGDFILLKPELLNDYASTIVNVARNHPEGLGSVAEIDILNAEIEFEDMERIDPDSERLLLHAVVELLMGREIALREGQYLVFPSKFNRKWSELPENPNIEVIYDFEGPIEDIYASLVVRIFYSDVFKLKDLWKDGAEFYDPSENICGIIFKSYEGKGSISIFFENGVSTDIRVLFSKFIHEHLEKKAIFESVNRERIYRCLECGEKVGDKKAIMIRLSRGKPNIICQYCDSSIYLLDLIERKFGDPAVLNQLKELDKNIVEKKEEAIGIAKIRAKHEIDEFDVFLAHNSDEKALVESIGSELSYRGLNAWLDKWNIPPGRIFQEEIEKVLPSIKAMAIIVGQSGIGPWERLEIRLAISQFVKRELPVIPVLLPGVSDELVSDETILTPLLKEFGWVKFDSIDDQEALDNLEWGITGVHPRRKTNKFEK